MGRSKAKAPKLNSCQNKPRRMGHHTKSGSVRSMSKKKKQVVKMQKEKATRETSGIRPPNAAKIKKIKDALAKSGKVLAVRPPRFSWVVPGRLAAQGRPTKPGHVQYLVDNGVTTLLTLTENKPTVLHAYPGPGLEWMHLPLRDEKPPTQDDVKHFIEIVNSCKDQNKVLTVHCAWGLGRTGTMLACHLVATKRISAKAAIAEIRKMRKGSIDTAEQEGVVAEWEETVHRGKVKL